MNSSAPWRALDLLALCVVPWSCGPCRGSTETGSTRGAQRGGEPTGFDPRFKEVKPESGRLSRGIVARVPQIRISCHEAQETRPPLRPGSRKPRPALRYLVCA